jgi:hypothetical protein
MSAELSIVEVSPYDCLTSNIAYEEVSHDGCAWRLTGGQTDDMTAFCDKDLASTLIQQPGLFSRNEQTKILVLNCSSGCAGIAALQLGYRDVVFVDRLARTLSDVWENVFLNAPDFMTSARCFTTGGVHWADLNEASPNPVW